MLAGRSVELDGAGLSKRQAKLLFTTRRPKTAELTIWNSPLSEVEFLRACAKVGMSGTIGGGSGGEAAAIKGKVASLDSGDHYPVLSAETDLHRMTDAAAKAA